MNCQSQATILSMHQLLPDMNPLNCRTHSAPFRFDFQRAASCFNAGCLLGAGADMWEVPARVLQQRTGKASLHHSDHVVLWADGAGFKVTDTQGMPCGSQATLKVRLHIDSAAQGHSTLVQQEILKIKLFNGILSEENNVCCYMGLMWRVRGVSVPMYSPWQSGDTAKYFFSDWYQIRPKSSKKSMSDPGNTLQ